MKRMDAGALVLAAAVGAAVGAAVALVLAPASGEETRRRLAEALRRAMPAPRAVGETLVAAEMGSARASPA